MIADCGKSEKGMTTNAAPNLGISVTLLVLAWLVVPIAIYPAIEDRSLTHPLTQAYFLFALAAAVAPLGYSLKRLGNWRTWHQLPAAGATPDSGSGETLLVRIRSSLEIVPHIVVADVDGIASGRFL